MSPRHCSSAHRRAVEPGLDLAQRDLDAFAYRPKILHRVDETTGQPIERGTSVSVIYGIGLTFDDLWKL